MWVTVTAGNVHCIGSPYRRKDLQPRVQANQRTAQNGPKWTPQSGRLSEHGVALGRRNHLCMTVLKKQHERVIVEIHIPLLPAEVIQVLSSTLGCAVSVELLIGHPDCDIFGSQLVASGRPDHGPH